MKIHKDFKIELAASKDATRAAICEPFLDVKDGKGCLVATNGRTLAMVPVELGEKDASGFLSGDCLKAARKLTRETVQLDASGVCALTNGATMPREGGAAGGHAFPNWRQVVPADNANDGGAIIALDAKLLWELAQAMGTTGVLLKIKDSTAPVIIFPHVAGTTSNPIRYACEDARGVLMPIAQKAKA